MHVASLALHNWGPYRGKHVVELEPTVYAVVARHDDDPNRSNWAGKSWLLAAIPFGMFGVKPPGADTEDAWITDGEGAGGIILRLSDGTHIARERKRGKSTRLTVMVPGRKEAIQKRAQELLVEHLGLAAGDFAASCFIAQKQIARFVVAKPADRTKLVSEWLELGPLQAAEAYARDALRALLDEDGALQARIASAGGLDAAERASLEEQAESLQRALEEAEEAARAAREASAGAAEHRRHARQAAEFDEVAERGQALRARADGLDVKTGEEMDALEREADERLVEYRAARSAYSQLKEVTEGNFDGTCPVICESCPVADDVRRRGEELAGELAEAEAAVDEAQERSEAARRARHEALSAAQEAASLEATLEALRGKASALAASVDYIEDHGQPPADADLEEAEREAAESARAVREQLADVNAQLRQANAARDVIAKVEARRARLAELVKTHQEAVAILGRSGAQREIAERVLVAIEAGANALLDQAGIDLRVAVQWAREGQGLAGNCEQCGHGFPASAKVKTCSACGAERGPNIVEKLDLELTDRSGAAEDMAGLAFQLAAATWLRAKRGTPWSAVFIDEPFGALDGANKEALSTHLHAMLRGRYAFDQAFVVAHDAGIMEALPARITVRVGPGGSRPEVS